MKLEVEFKFQKRAVVGSTSFSRPAARASRRASSQANGGTAVIHQKSINKNSECWGEATLV